MIARPLDLAWDAQTELSSFQVELNDNRWAGFARRIVSRPMVVRCPGCSSIVYSRRHKHCSVCSRELPQHLLFSDAESQRVERVLQSERNEHRRWMRKQDCSS